MVPPAPAHRSGLGDSNDQTRRHNLSTLLTIVHHDGPQTRAELTRRTGLNRSTIATVVGELASLGYVYETQPTEAGTVGRPSPLVHANAHIAALTINPDIDAITLGLVGLGGIVHSRVRRESVGIPSVDQTVEIVASMIADLDDQISALSIIGIGIAVPGLIRLTDGVVVRAPHLMWTDVPIAQPLSEALGYPAYAANDASIGTLAESIFGAGRGCSELIYLNGSASGIGGGVVVAGRPVRGTQGYAGELGHTVVNSNGAPCFCGRRGCLETEVDRRRLLRALGRRSSDADRLDQLLAESTDAGVRAEVNRQIDWLAIALGNLIGIFDPEIIIVGGFLRSLLLADTPRLQAAVRKQTFGALADHVRIEPAQLGPQLLTVGTAELAFAPLLADPAGFATHTGQLDAEPSGNLTERQQTGQA